MTDASVDQNTVSAPLRINSSTRLAIIITALIYFAAFFVWLALRGDEHNGLHQTLLTGGLWIVASILGLMGAPTALDSARAFFVKQ